MKMGSSSKVSVRVDQLLIGQRISLICSHRKIEYPQREVTNAPQQTIYKKSISTFLRLAWALGLKEDLAASRAKSRASSCSSRPMKRVFVFGQHFGFDGHASHIALVARYLRRPIFGSFLRGSE
ncbi:hypothetical protein ROLI_005770 [Roseobacter fucihabitans]|uniref:Uncharacterized protein n=1 Tax=Roseobacter fucihabitans TaxID=1537242 RepID=A0ABZ2BNC4_9RHOB|nr:hypothetical protein [Roseobacter litoralis]